MKTCGCGARGLIFGIMFAFSGSRSPFLRLHGAHEATMLSHSDEPPLLRGITWSTVRFERAPQYWHVHPSRAKTARRVIFRRCASRGTFTYETRRMTMGLGSVVCSDRRAQDACSITSAFCLRSSTVARRTVQTLIGS